MSLYNMLFGKNGSTAIILATLGLKESDVPRFRDVTVSESFIEIYTRMGGGNYGCWDWDSETPDGEDCQCAFCEDVCNGLEKHSNYSHGEDDDFDCTYRTFYFTFPEDYKAELTALGSNTEIVKPGDKWTSLFKSLEAQSND